MHLQHPVAEAVHDQLQHPRVGHVQRVATTGEVDVVAAVVRRQPVVRRIVDAAQGQRRAQLIAFRGVIVDNVENDLDAGGVQGLDHALELSHRRQRIAGGGIAQVGGEERERVVAPVVGQPARDQMAIVRVVVHRHQFERGDPQALEVLDDRRSGERGVGAAEFHRDVGMARREPFDMRFVDHRLVPRRPQQAIRTPRELGIDHRRERRARRVVAIVGRQPGITDPIAEHRVIPLHRPRHRLGIRIDQQFRRIEAVAGPGIVLTLDAEAIQLARLDSGQVAVPDHIGLLDERDPR